MGTPTLPTTTADVIAELRGQGLVVDTHYIKYMIRSGRIPKPRYKMGRSFGWLPEDIERLRRVLIARGRVLDRRHPRPMAGASS